MNIFNVNNTIYTKTKQNGISKKKQKTKKKIFIFCRNISSVDEINTGLG